MNNRRMRLLALMMALAMLAALLPAQAFAAQDTGGGWQYTRLSDGTAQLTGYTGPQEEALTLPERVDGYWVSGVADEAFAGMSWLTDVTVPSGIGDVSLFAFPDSPGLTVRAYNGAAALAFASDRGLKAVNLSPHDFFDDILDLSYLGGRVTMDGGALFVPMPEARLIRENQGLYIAPNGLPEHGVAVTVTSVTLTENGASAACKTRPFEDTVEEYHLSDARLTVDTAHIVPLIDGLEIIAPSSAGGGQTRGSANVERSVPLRLNFRTKDLAKSSGVEAQVSLGLNITSVFSVDYSHRRIDRQTIGLEMPVSIEVEFTGEHEFAKQNAFDADEVQVGGLQKLRVARLPLVGTPLVSVMAELYLCASLNGEVTVSVNLTGQFLNTYENGTWRTTRSFSGGGELEAKVEGRLYTEMTFSVELGFSAIEKLTIRVAEAVFDLGVGVGFKYNSSAPECLDVRVRGFLEVELNVGILSSSVTRENQSLYLGGTIVDAEWEIFKRHWEGTIHKWTDRCLAGSFVTVDCMNQGALFDTYTVLRGETVSPETPMRPGYRFIGWYDSMMLSQFDFSQPLEEDVTVYANWEPLVPDGAVIPGSNNGAYAGQPLTFTEPGRIRVDVRDYSQNGGPVQSSTYYEDCVAVIGCNEGAVSVTVPAVWEGHRVVSVWDGAFSGCKNLRSVSISGSVRHVGDRAFSGCTALETVTIPSSVLVVGDGCFQNCVSLQSVTLPDGLISIQSKLFNGCTSLQTVNIPSGVRSICDNAFNSCTSLTSVTLPGGLQTILSSAFSKCTALKGIDLPGGLTNINNSAFMDCRSITHVTLPGALQTMGNYVFQNCTGLKTVSVASGMQTIPVGAFVDCTALESVFISGAVTKISDNAFAGCSALSNIRLSSNIKEIGWWAFRNTALRELNFHQDGLIIRGDAFKEIPTLREVTLSGNNINLVNSAFQNDTGLRRISITGSGINICDNSFINAGTKSGALEIRLTGSNNTFGTNVFQNAPVTSLRIEGSGNQFGTASLQQLPLVTVSVGGSGNVLGDSALYGCRQLKSVDLSGAVSLGSSCLRYTGLRTVYLPDTITSIGSWCFYETPLIVAYVDSEAGVPAQVMTTDWPHVTLVVKGARYPVTFHSLGGTAVEMQLVTADSTVTEPAAPTRSGYIFGGWYTDPGLTEMYVFANAVVSPLDLYAAWLPDESSLWYQTDGEAATLEALTADDLAVTLPDSLGGRPLTALSAGAVPAGVRYLSLPATLTSIDGEAFTRATFLASISMRAGNAAGYYTEGGALFRRVGTVSRLVCWPQALAELSVSSKYIGRYGIYGNGYLETLSFPSGMTLEDRAVTDCRNLTSVTFAGDIKSIGEGNFDGAADGFRIYGPLSAPKLSAWCADHLIPYNEYTIRFLDENGQSVLFEARCPAGGRIGYAPDYVPKEGYAVTGWVTGDGESFDPVNGTMPRHDLTLTAVVGCDFTYEIEQYTNELRLIRYNGAATAVRVPYLIEDGVLTSIADDCFPARVTKLIGEAGTAAEDFAYRHSLDFEAIRHTITFDPMGGTQPGPMTFTAGDVLYLPGSYKECHELLCWSEDPYSYNREDIITAAANLGYDLTEHFPNRGTRDLTLYAVWGPELTPSGQALEAPYRPYTFEEIDRPFYHDGVKVTDTTVRITGYTGTGVGAVWIPCDINGGVVTEIGPRAFYGQKGLTTVTLPATIETVGDEAFAGSSVRVVNTAYSDFPQGIEVMGGSHWTSVGRSAFANCPDLEEVYLGANVTSVGKYAFAGDVSMKGIPLDSLTSLSEGMFSGCTSLTDLYMPQVRSIADGAFAGCVSLQGIELPSCLEHVTARAFTGANRIFNFYMPDGGAYLKVVNEALYSADGGTLIAYPHNKQDDHLTLPDGVAMIAPYAFEGSRLHSVTLNAGLAGMGEGAFMNSPYLEEVVFAEGLTALPDKAFAGCYALSSVTLPASLESFGENVFPLKTVINVTAGSAAETWARAQGYTVTLVGARAVEGISLSADEVFWPHPGDLITLQTIFEPADTTETDLLWRVDNGAVISVLSVEDGVFTLEARGVGEATLTVRSARGQTAECRFSVWQPEIVADGIFLSADSLTVMKGSMVPLTAWVTPEDTTYAYTYWTSSDERVAVCQDGWVIGRAPGEAVLTAHSHKGLEAVCVVTVLDPTAAFASPTFVLPDALTEVDEEAFAGVLTERIQCNARLRRIGARAFADNPMLQQVLIPGSVTTIAPDAFSGCPASLVVFGQAGSAAETWATERGYTFIQAE